MTGPLTEKEIDDWLKDFTSFSSYLTFRAGDLCKSVGYHFEVDQEALRSAHNEWVALCEYWLKSKLMPNSNGLSHLKLMALLLYALCKFDWVKVLLEWSANNDGSAFDGTPEERRELQRDINKARGKFLAYTFAIDVIEWFEQGREDRVEEFVPRMTHDMEHDLLAYLMAGNVDPIGLFLILKALYVRTDKAELDRLIAARGA